MDPEVVKALKRQQEDFNRTLQHVDEVYTAREEESSAAIDQIITTMLEAGGEPSV